MSNVAYIKDGVMQPSTLMTRELAAKCQVGAAAFALPSGSKNNAGGANDLQKDYYTAQLDVTYPDGSGSKAFVIPEVVVYNAPRMVGNTTRYPVGFSRGFVSYFEPLVRRAYPGFTFNDRRFSDTPEYVWTELKIYGPRPGEGEINVKGKRSSESVPVEVSQVVNGEKRSFAYDSFKDFFTKFTCAAIVGKLTCTIKMQAEITKGQPLPGNAEAKPVLVPTMFNIFKPVDIPQPVVLSGQKSATTEADNADSSFFSMLMEMNVSKDEDEDEPRTNTSTAAPTPQGTADDEEFTDEDD